MRTWTLAVGAFGLLLVAGCGGSSPPVEDVLERYHGGIIAGDVEEAMGTLAEDAEWGFSEVRFTLDERIPEEYEWLASVLGLEADATGRDIVRAYTEYLVASRAVPTATNCVGNDEAVACTYTLEDGLVPVTGMREMGSLEATTRGGRLVRYAVVTDGVQQEPDAAVAAFWRWSAVRDPETANPLPLVPAQAARLLEAYEAWEAEGRPDIEPVVELDDPIAVAEAWFAANNAGDWEAQVSLTGGELLFLDPFPSWDEFEAARAMDRTITLDACSITLETSDETRIACDVTVTDIVTAAAGVPATNPNQTSMAIGDGRMVGAPRFLPSHFAAEQEIEIWAQREQPDNYRRACPDGIAGQSEIIGLSCARFIATYEGHWAPLIGELDLG